MHLQNLRLYHFRNYEERFFTFSPGINCIVGKNGSGKTNLLDAVYFLALCKSSIHAQDSLSIRFGEDFSSLEGAFSNGNIIGVHLQRTGKKTVTTDHKVYEKLAEHIGKYPVVLLTPNDTDLIRDAAETRRKLFDGILSQLDPEYLQIYLRYNKTLDQRNSLLKQFAEQNYLDEDLLHIYTQGLLTAGRDLYLRRADFIRKFEPLFIQQYQYLSEEREAVELLYESDLAAPDFEEKFRKNLPRDLSAQRTTLGVHKDDYSFLMERAPIKKFGSQGQKKSYVMALKLAQFQIIEEDRQTKPLLLLDDIFDKLDDRRIACLIERMDSFGQVFLTDARPERTAELLRNTQVNRIEL
jgi:DNA replication and repair protein RecF